MSSSDSETDSQPLYRLGDCEVCGDNKAIYTCPKCEVKTCGLNCVRIHKKELECDGVRDRTKFVRMKDFSDTDLLSDYRMLEECARFVYGVKRDEKKRFTRIDKDLPIHLFKLRNAARKRGIVLQFLAQNFTRHKMNTTKYNFKTEIINWRVEWVFPNVDTDPIKFIDEKCSERKRLSELLDKYLDPDAAAFEGSKALTYYKSVGFSGVKVLLKAEKVRGSSKKFFELDPTETLADNLSGKCIVEFPIVFVVLKDHAYNLDIIAPEDTFEYHSKKEKEDLSKEKIGNREQRNVTHENIRQRNGNQNYSMQTQRGFYKRKRELLTEKVAKEKELEIKNEIKAERKKRPKNLLFTTGYSSEESLGDSDSDNAS